MLGRSSDSYIDKSGNIIYLFDTEYSLSIEDPIIEWEISAFEINDGNYVKVAQVVLKPEFSHSRADVIEQLCEKYKLDAVKIYDAFDNSDVTGKRDYQRLKDDKTGYYALCDESHFYKISFANECTSMSKILKTDLH